jgi:hypothetical protein
MDDTARAAPDRERWGYCAQRLKTYDGRLGGRNAF